MSGRSELSLRPVFELQHRISARAVSNTSPRGGYACPAPLIRITLHIPQKLKPLPVQPPLNGRLWHLNSRFDVPNFEYGESPPFRRGYFDLISTCFPYSGNGRRTRSATTEAGRRTGDHEPV